MADRYWIGGTGTTGDTTKWSNISGGTGGFSVPVYGDNIYIDTNSHLGAPFEIALSATSIFADKLNISTLTFSLSLINNSNKSIDLIYGINIQDNKVYLNGSGSFLYIYPPTDISTATFNSVIKFRNFGNIELFNCILKSNLHLSASVSNGFSEFYAYGNFNSNNKNITISNYYFVYFNGASGNSSITVLNNFSNSTIFIDGIKNGIYFTNVANDLTKVKYDFTNSELTLSAYVSGIISEFTHKSNFSLPKITYNIGSLLGSASNPNKLGVYANDYIINKSVYIPKLTINLKDNNTTYKGYEYFKFETYSEDIGKIEFNIGELAISCSEQNRVVFDGNSSRVFIQSASLSQVIFTRCNITGFRDLSVSFSASNIGEFTYNGIKNTNIKIPAPRTVYWNAPTGGNFISNSYTSATGGTVTSTWIPFPQDTVKFVDTGLNSSATISFNAGKSLFLGRIDTSERTIPMTFHLSLNTGNAYITNGFITNSNTLFKGATNSSLEIHGTCTLNVVNSLTIPVEFWFANVAITCPLNISKNFRIYQSSVNFNENTLSATTIYTTGINNIIDPPPRIIIGGTSSPIWINIDFPSTTFRLTSTLTANRLINNTTLNPKNPLNIKGLIFEGGSTSYGVTFAGPFHIGDFIYNKTGNINFTFDYNSGPYVIDHIKAIGIFNGSITASIRFSSSSSSLTAVLTYAGINAAESLSFITFNTVSFEPFRNGALCNRVFSGEKYTLINPPTSVNGVNITDKPYVVSVNANNDVPSGDTIKIVANRFFSFGNINPFSITYKTIPITDCSINTSATYIATFPNYFSNNIKVGTKHELKIIRGN